jgi:hypothetical protein
LPAATVFQQFVYAPQAQLAPAYQSVPRRDESNALLREVNRLRQEVQQLRDEQRRSSQAAAVTPPKPAASTELVSLPIVLIFVDGRRMEVPGYVIVDRSLWAVTEPDLIEIPVSDLDLEATQTINGERGVRFPLPR